MSCPGNGSAGAGCSTWSAQCMALLSAAGNPTSGLVDKNGVPMAALNNNTWGITYDTCNQYCSWSAIPLPSYFDFESFSGAMTNYFLPWLALAAQLPYENDTAWNTFMAFCLAVGSPALVTYSLMITLLNRNWVQNLFKGLIQSTEKARVQARYPTYTKRVKSVLYLLTEAQQVPLRATQVDFRLAGLVVLPKNHEWWMKLKGRLRGSRRGISFSLVAQVMLAAFVWIFTIVSSSQVALGNSTNALQIAAATLWIWLIPITFGWIAVGTQTDSGTIQHALEADKAYFVAKSLGLSAPEPHLDSQDGIEVRSGLTRQASRNSRATTQRGTMSGPTAEIPIIPTTWGMNICGDERLIGPMYNYARVFTWWSFSTTLYNALSNTTTKIEDNSLWTTDDSNPLVGDGPHISNCCGLRTDGFHQILAYPDNARPPTPSNRDEQSPSTPGSSTADDASTSDAAARVQGQFDSIELQPIGGVSAPEAAASVQPPVDNIEDQPSGGHSSLQSRGVDSEIYVRMAIAVFAALSVQWTTTLSAFIMAYLTPTVGLGCRSGGYMIYGLAGSVVMFLMIWSMLLSNSAMGTYQSRYSNWTTFDEAGKFNDPETMFDGLPQSAVCRMAVLTRVAGKTLAVANMLWLIATSIFEYIGLYNNCWCKSCVAGLGQGGWAVLFKSDVDFQSVAQGPWAGGIAMSTIVCCFFWAIFALGAKRNK